MRGLEILLLLTDLTALAYLLFSGPITRRGLIAIGAGCLLALGGHLLFEGFRWQMVFIYLAGIFFPGLAFLKYSGSSERRAHKRIYKVCLSAAALFFLSISAFLSVAMPVLNLPAPTGAYRVGTQTFHFIDAARDESLTEDGKDKRELMVQVWYPASDSEKTGALLFPEDRDVFGKYIREYSKRLNLPAFVLDYWKYMRTNSVDKAQLLPSDQPYPVVVLCHGMGTGRVLHASQAENLASHGYIAIAADHTYSTTATAFPDGRITGLETSMNIKNMGEIDAKVGLIWEKDVEFLTDQLEKINSGEIVKGFEGKIDLDRIGIMGHSFGGSVAYNAVNMSGRIKAGINMDGTLFELGGSRRMHRPFMFITNDTYEKRMEIFKKPVVTDADLALAHLTRENYAILKPIMDEEREILDDIVGNQGISIRVEGTEHYNFTDFQLFSELLGATGMTGKIKGGRGAAIINRYVLDFFDHYLKGTGGNLLSGPSPEFPEVSFGAPD